MGIRAGAGVGGLWSGEGLRSPLLSAPIPPPGVIKLKNNGDFFIANEGRRPIYIDGRPVLGGNKWKLNNNSVVEVSPDVGGGSRGGRGAGGPTLLTLCPPPPQIASLRFVFLINQDLIALIKAEAAKLAQQ